MLNWGPVQPTGDCTHFVTTGAPTLSNDGSTLYGQLFLPPDSPAGKIPVIVYVYGGPAAQLVTDAWEGTNGLFHQRLLRKGFAIFTVDNRGTPNRGRDFSDI